MRTATTLTTIVVDQTEVIRTTDISELAFVALSHEALMSVFPSGSLFQSCGHSQFPSFLNSPKLKAHESTKLYRGISDRNIILYLHQPVITLNPLTGKENNTDYIITEAPVKW